MSPLERAVIRAEIEELITDYGYLFDHGRADEMPSLFTEHARFVGLAGSAQGHDELRALFTSTAARMAKTRHVCTNLRLEIESERRARGTVVVTSYGHRGEGVGKPLPHTVGDFHDVYVRDDEGRWRFAERRIDVAFSALPPNA